ncbi:MAG: hypothetical protein K5756_01890 [Clostridiales bacterium]|nr:hypothetical protein [Clostridiales bacterium]
MKRTTRFISILLAVAMMFSGVMTVFAEEILPSPADNAVDTSVYVKTVLQDPKVKQNNAERFVLAANILTDADEKIKSELSDNVLTGQSIIVVIDSIVDAISQKLESDSSLAAVASFIKYVFTSRLIADGLKQDEKFAGAADKFIKADKEGVLTVTDVADSDIEFTSADFGFKDGDAYGFFDAFFCSISEICTQLNVRSILGDFTDSVKNGEYVVGNYNLFIPLYELLGLVPMSSVEFTKLVTQAETAPGADSHARFRTAAYLTFKPAADLLMNIQKGGVNAAIDILPKLLYALDSGTVNDLVRSLLQDKNLFYMFQFNDMLEDMDLSADLIWNAIDKKYITGTEEEPAGFDFDNDGEKETTLPMTKEQFDAAVKNLAFAADPVVKASVSSTEKNRLALETDRALVSAILCDTAVEFAETKEGAAFIKTAAIGIKGKTVGQLTGFAVSLLGSNMGRFLLSHTQDLLAEIAPAAARSVKLIDALRIYPAE